MLSQTDYLKPNVAEVAAKLFDGEAIIMNLTTGMYFSADRVGAVVWELVEAGYCQEAIAGSLSSRYEVSAEQALEDVQNLVQQMLEEGLIIVAPEGVAAAPENGGTDRGAYEAPVLHKYDDMAELLALDPPMPGLGDWADPVDPG